MSLRFWTQNENGNYTRTFDDGRAFTVFPDKSGEGWAYAGGKHRAKRLFPNAEAAAHAATGAAAGARGMKASAMARSPLPQLHDGIRSAASDPMGGSSSNRR